MTNIFNLFKGIFIFRWIGIILKQCWVFILLFIFFPEINNLMSRFSWWTGYVAAASEYISTLSNTLRSIPFIQKGLNIAGEWWVSIRMRILEILL